MSLKRTGLLALTKLVSYVTKLSKKLYKSYLVNPIGKAHLHDCCISFPALCDVTCAIRLKHLTGMNGQATSFIKISTMTFFCA